MAEVVLLLVGGFGLAAAYSDRYLARYLSFGVVITIFAAISLALHEPQPSGGEDPSGLIRFFLAATVGGAAIVLGGLVLAVRWRRPLERHRPGVTPDREAPRSIRLRWLVARYWWVALSVVAVFLVGFSLVGREDLGRPTLFLPGELDGKAVERVTSFEEFPLLWLGESFEGFALTALIDATRESSVR